jgi:hypothetical protein
MSNTSEQVTLYIDSSKRTTGTNENFTITLSPYISRIRKVDIISLEIPFSFYIINSNNNILNFNDGTTNYILTIPEGNYDGTTLPKTLETLFNNVSSGFNITYLDNTYKLRFQRSSGNFKLIYNGSTSSFIIGLSSDSALTNDFTCQDISNLSGPNYLLISSNALTRPKVTRSYNSNSQSNILYKVPINVSPGSAIVEKNIYPVQIVFALAQTVKEIDLQLLFPNGNTVNLNGQPWSMTIVLTKG